MSSTASIFDSFDNLDQIDVENLKNWIKPVLKTIPLENYLANRILYPQTSPLTESDMKIDLAILREALRLNGPNLQEKENPAFLSNNPFLNVTLRKIIIPEKFLYFIPDLVSLTWAFVDGLLLNRERKDWFEDLWTVVVADDVDLIVGSVLIPQFEGNHDMMVINLLGKEVKIKPGSLTVVPCPKDRCEIAYKFEKGKILGKKEAALEISGGKLGLIIDGRNI